MVEVVIQAAGDFRRFSGDMRVKAEIPREKSNPDDSMPVCRHNVNGDFLTGLAMTNDPLREFDDADCERLKARAAPNIRSLEAELREISVSASNQVDIHTARATADAMRRRLDGRPHSNSGEILAVERLR
jgi:plasmid stability protein